MMQNVGFSHLLYNIQKCTQTYTVIGMCTNQEAGAGMWVGGLWIGEDMETAFAFNSGVPKS
jgi:hypothetical protein